MKVIIFILTIIFLIKKLIANFSREFELMNLT